MHQKLYQRRIPSNSKHKTTNLKKMKSFLMDFFKDPDSTQKLHNTETIIQFTQKNGGIFFFFSWYSPLCHITLLSIFLLSRPKQHINTRKSYKFKILHQKQQKKKFWYSYSAHGSYCFLDITKSNGWNLFKGETWLL